MASKILRSSGAETLAFLQQVIGQEEGIFGPLIALTSEDNKNYLVFQRGGAPQNRVVLEAISGEPAPTKPGFQFVCSGVCLISDEQAWVAAYRQ